MNRVPGVVVTPYVLATELDSLTLIVDPGIMERFRTKAKTITWSSTSSFVVSTR